MMVVYCIAVSLWGRDGQYRTEILANDKIHLKLFCIVFYKILPVFTSLQGFFYRFST